MIGITELENVMRASINGSAEVAVELAGFVYDDVGLMCGRFAQSALDELGIEKGDPRYREFGEVITTAILAAVEVVLTAKA